MDQWDRFDASAPRQIDELGFSDNIDVFEPTETYTAGEGFSTTYPGSADQTISGEVVPPSADPLVQENGTLAEKDLMVYVDDDTGLAFTEYGESGESSAKLSISGFDDDFRVEERNDQLDGYIQLGCVEI